MSLPASYNGKALSPTVVISDLDDVTQFTFESKAIDASPTQDFRLNALGIHAGINDDHGNCLLLLEDSNNIMTDSDVRKASRAKSQWNIKINLGKGITGDRWFHGKIMTSNIVRSRTGEQFVKIIGGGWGMRTLERLSKIERIQERENSDGTTFDVTDTKTNIVSLINDIFQDQDHYILRSLGTESEITLTGVDSNTTQLTEFKDYYQSWSFLMSRLAAIGGSVWGIDANRDLFYREPQATSSGLLITGDVSGVVSQKWNPAKLMYNLGPLEYTDGVGDSGYSVLHGPGATTDSIDINVDPVVNADFDLSANWLAVEWTTGQDTLSKIAAKFKRVGTPASGDAFFQIVGEASGGGPNLTDSRKKVRIPIQILNGFGIVNPNVMKEYSFEKIKVTPDEKLYCVFERYGNGSNHYEVQYDSAGALTYYISADGSSWSSTTGDFAFRTYPTRTLNVILYNTVAARRFGVREKVIDIKNVADIVSIRKVMQGLSDIMGKEKRQYRPVITTVPDNYYSPGQTLRIMDPFGLNTNAVILGWDISMSASDNRSKLGTSDITWNLGEFY